MRRKRSRPLSRAEVVSLSLGVITVVAFAAVSMTIDASPTPREFDGWIAVLQRGRARTSQVLLSAGPVQPGGWGHHPQLRYSVAVCGSKPFRGALLLGEDARLDDPSALAPPAPLEEQATGTAPALVSSRTLKMEDVSTASSQTYEHVQVIRLALPSSRCAPAGSGGFFGSGTTLVGSAKAPVEARSEGPLGLWSGPRSTQSWPYIGAMPEVDPHDIGEFRFTRGLGKGPWIRPSVARFEVNVGTLAGKAAIDFARPHSSSSSALAWSSSEPYAAIARLTDSDELGTWQTFLTLATIALAIGGSLVAAVFLRRPQPPRPSRVPIAAEPAEPPAPQPRTAASTTGSRYGSPLALFLAFLLGARFARGRRRRG
jgi:hypothetical protein